MTNPDSGTGKHAAHEGLEEYTRNFAGHYLGSHGVASPFGLWLLLALLAPAARGEERGALEEALGSSIEDANLYARRLIGNPHPALKAAFALWSAPNSALAPAFGEWSGTLPDEVTRGPLPSQEAADAWARENTHGLIKKFPIELQPDTALILASSLASRINWSEFFDDASSEELGGTFGKLTPSALRSAESHTSMILHTEAAGTVAVHAAESNDGLQVISVIAAPAVKPERVHAAGLEVAKLLQNLPSTAKPLNLFDLPLEDGHAWHLDERRGLAVGVHSDQVETFESLLAPWSASSDFDLSTASGVITAFDVLDGFLLPEHRPGRFECRQSALASYQREGFEAAAVTAFSARMGSAHSPREVTFRHATLTFNRPYAVLAVTRDWRVDPEKPWERIPLDPSWKNVPVFAAWVEHPDNPNE